MQTVFFQEPTTSSIAKRILRAKARGLRPIEISGYGLERTGRILTGLEDQLKEHGEDYYNSSVLVLNVLRSHTQDGRQELRRAVVLFVPADCPGLEINRRSGERV